MLAHQYFGQTKLSHRDRAIASPTIALGRGVISFGQQRPAQGGFWLDDRAVCWETAESSGAVELPDRFVYLGTHQRLNAAAAIAAALTRGADLAAVRAGLERFEGVRDRAELVAEIDGVLTSMTPRPPRRRLQCPLDAFPGRALHVIAGGFDKKLELAPLGCALADKAASIILLDGPRRLADGDDSSGGRKLAPPIRPHGQGGPGWRGQAAPAMW